MLPTPSIFAVLIIPCFQCLGSYFFWCYTQVGGCCGFPQRYGVSMTKMISPTGKKIIEKTQILLCKEQCPNDELGRLSLKLTIDINILKFWIHLQNLPDDDIARQCLHLSKDMAEKNQPGISQIKIKTLCDEYSLCSNLQCRSKSVQSFNQPPTLNSGNLFLQYFQNRYQQNRISRWN